MGLFQMAFALSTLQDSSKLRFSLHLEASPGVRNTSFVQVHEQFKGTNWHSLKVDPETANSWDNTHAPIEVQLLQSTGPWTLYLEGGIQRDIEAWYQDSHGANIPHNIDEVNISSTPEFWGQYQDSLFHLQLGQFQPRFGPSPERGVVISGPALHRGLETGLHFYGHQFTWFWSSLDPHLSAAEQEVQSTSPISNARGQVYNQAVKNLFVHRLDLRFGIIELGFMESVIIGGKQADFWEVQPFTVYHNNYPDGYGNNLLSLDFKLQVHPTTSLYGEIGLDDLTGGNAESSENSSNTIAWMLGTYYERPYLGGTLKNRLEIIKISPAYGNRDLTLLEYTQRQVIRSNYRHFDTHLGDEELFADTYIIDRPIGYDRGPDIQDLWWDISYARQTWGVSYQLGYLQKGYYDFNTPYQQGTNNPPGPTSPTLTEWRQQIIAHYLPFKTLSTSLGVLHRNQYQGGQDWALSLATSWYYSIY